ncbi:hypothetical protein ACFFTN_21040 [Aminobacter aganoensis]|uniref:Uncharacterized protein n=1 Tax=Aminobacter aganoensis TaxID=83264 RepID=A0A7X0FC51_9HYPH|nr:hypothetical protein [Aminobacter aganoensis]MBB6356947.1 hypothetical protein [Aminobacter aganoensis]
MEQTQIADWLDDFAKQVTDGMTGRPDPNSEIPAKLADLVGLACSPDRKASFDSLLCYIMAANGLHAAAARARSMNDYRWARSLHEQGQLFLSYATGDLALMVHHILNGGEAPLTTYVEPESPVHRPTDTRH